MEPTINNTQHDRSVYYLIASVVVLAAVLIVLKGMEAPTKEPASEAERTLTQQEMTDIAKNYMSTTTLSEKEKEAISARLSAPSTTTKSE